MTARWALRDLLRHPVRAILSLLGVAIASALLLDMVLLGGGIEHSFAHLLLARGYQLRISPEGTLPFDTEASIGDAASLLAKLRAEPGVAQVAPVLGTTLLARAGDGRVPVVGYGIDPEAQGIYSMERGSDLARGDTAGVLLGEPAARRLALDVGDTLELTGHLDPATAQPVSVRRLAVRGIVRFLYDARDQPSLALPLAVAQQLAGPSLHDRISLVQLRVADDAAADSIATTLRARFPNIAVNSVADMVVQFRLRLSYFRQLSLILGSISLIVTVLLVGTLLAIGVNERIGEIAAMRAIGVARGTVIRQVVLQGLILTLGGGSLGILLGLVTARWLDAILTSFPGLPAAISFFVAEPRSLLAAAATLFVTGLLAGIPPAWRAASAPIAATLRSDAP